MNGRPWTQEEVEILKERYHNTTAQDLADLLERHISSIYGKAAALKLQKDPEFIRELGKKYAEHPEVKKHQFKPGTVPLNKGKKMDPDVYKRCAGTMFKPGNIPPNYKPVGSERVNVDGYIEVKVKDPRTWKLKHRVVWEQANGPIPAGHNIQFKNGNPKDVRLENLYIISKSEQLRTENSMIARYPEELRSVIHMKAALKRKINTVNRTQNEEHKS